MTAKQHQRSVGRPREFDEEAVLNAAIEAFWAQGYEATSLADLCECTGLHKGSLYQAFGDKRNLFMASLKHYATEQFRGVMAAASESESPLENIRAAVHQITDDAGSEKGCLVINSIVELAPHDPEIKATLQSYAGMRIQAMTQMIGLAQQAGEIRPELDPAKLARQLMITLAGAATVVKGFVTHDQALETLDGVIDSWT